MKFIPPFDPADLRQRMQRGLQQASDVAARVQARLENRSTMRLLRMGGDLAVALGTIAMQQANATGQATGQAMGQAMGQAVGKEAFARATRGGMLAGAVSSAAIAASMHLHRRARGEITWREAIAGTGRETFCGAGSGAASTLAASASTLALGAIGAPFIAKAAAPAVAAALAGWLAQEAAEKALRMAQDWALVPDHALPERPQD